MPMRKRRTRLHRLKNGRDIEYVEYGDSKGTPVFYFHCFMGSCHQAVLAHEDAKRLGLRIIAPNRPGIGESSLARFRKMTGYADDIRELADHLRIDEFAAVGASSGACFALAVGNELRDRVKLVGAAGCIGPMNVIANMKHMPMIRRVMLNVCYFYPRVAWFVIAMFFRLCRAFPKLSFQWIIRTSSVLDAETVQQPEIGRILWWDHQAVLLRNGAVDGLILEMKLYFNWGFDLKNYPKETRVLAWHGTDDPLLPPEIIRRMSESMPNTKTIVCEGGHLTFLMHHMDTMLSMLRSEWDKAHVHPVRDRRDVLRDIRDWILSPWNRPHSA